MILNPEALRRAFDRCERPGCGHDRRWHNPCTVTPDGGPRCECRRFATVGDLEAERAYVVRLEAERAAEVRAEAERAELLEAAAAAAREAARAAVADALEEG